MPIYNKLVRDKIPEKLQDKKISFKTHIALDKEYWDKLTEKLREEVEEFIKDNNQEELADIMEVFNAICDFKNFKKENIENIRKEKFNKRGGFEKKIILEETD